MDPPGIAKPDCLIAAEIANTLKAMYEKEDNKAMAKRFAGFDWKLRKQGNNGVQLPVQEYRNGKLVGTEMVYTDYKFSTSDGKAHFLPATWTGLPAMVETQRKKYRFWINNGRTNHIWQTAYHESRSIPRMPRPWASSLAMWWRSTTTLAPLLPWPTWNRT